MYKILLIDDDELVRETLRVFLNKSNYNIITADTGIKGMELLAKENPDLVITDLVMPEVNGFQILEEAAEIDRNIPVIMITAYDDMMSTIKAIQLGAYDYIAKPIEKQQLLSIIERALNNKKIAEDSESKNENISAISKNTFIGNSQVIREIYKKVGQLSLNRVTVLVQGETGTGKELIARIIHYSGITKDKPFIAINCSALSEHLLESELFGHVKGAFTGAIRDKQGKFELAGEGTIFLDEISETSLNMQAKLLRVIQEREFEKVGGETLIPVRARIIASSNKNLPDLIKKNEFREDLYYRLKVFTINIPPLRSRKEDIPQIVVHLLGKINNELHKNVSIVPYDTMEFIQSYDWIGNVRELENVLTQAVVLSKGDTLEKEHIMFKKSDHVIPHTNENIPPTKPLHEIEREYIMRVLKHTNWNKTETAKILAIAKSTLYKKIEDYNIEKSLK